LFKSEFIPNAVLIVPIVLTQSEFTPNAVLHIPVVLFKSEFTPTAVLFTPVVLLRSASSPTAVVLAPVVLDSSVLVPTAVLLVPIVLALSALYPTATLAFAEVEEKSEEQSASLPIATWALPVVFAQSAFTPNAELLVPVVLIKSAFTPNADDLNDTFIPLGEGWQTSNYNFEIYDRWGELIFTTDNTSVGWKGYFKGSSEPVKNDVYVWKISVKDLTGKMHYFSGHIKVIR
jgi:gliding motility-associated-like protein